MGFLLILLPTLGIGSYLPEGPEAGWGGGAALNWVKPLRFCEMKAH